MKFCTVCHRNVPGDAEKCPYDGAPSGPSTPVSPDAGTTIKGRFSLKNVVAQGLTGTLYRAEDSEGGQDVLVKIIHPALEAAAPVKQRLKRELTQNAKLNTDAAAKVVDFGEDGNLMYLARTWIDGEPLSSVLLREKKLQADVAAKIAHQICTGLDAAHKVGLIHRDLKPGHVMLRSTDSGSEVALIDFGVTPPVDGVEGIKDLSGTPGYISPEQAEGKMVSFRSDFYALGVIIFEMITGRRLFEASGASELLDLHRSSEPEALSSVDSDVPKELSDLVAKLLSKRPASRPFSASMIQKELIKIYQDAASPAPAELSKSPEVVVSQPGPAQVPDELAMAQTVFGVAGPSGQAPAAAPAPAQTEGRSTQQVVKAPDASAGEQSGPVPAPAPKAVPAPTQAESAARATAPGVVKAPTAGDKPASGGVPDGAAKTMFGMPAVNAAALADAQKKPADSDKAAPSEADVKKTMLGMPAASAEKEEKAAADSAGKKEEKPAGEKAPEKKPGPAEKKEPETAIQKQEDEMPAEASAKKGIIIGAVIGVIILIILAIILFSGD